MANPHRFRFHLLALVLLAALAAAGCSSDSSETATDTSDAGSTSDDDTSDVAEDTPSGTDGDDAGSAGDDAAGGSTSSTTTSTTSSTTTTTVAVAADDPVVVAYCVAAAEADALADQVDPFDPEAVEAWANENIAALDAILPDAPAAIAEDLRTIRRSMDEFLVVLEAHDYDLIAAADDLEAISDLPAPTMAEDRIDEWEAANCADVDVPEPSTDTTFEDAFATPEAFEALLSSDAGRRLMIEGMIEDGSMNADQAECLLDNLDFEVLSALALTGEPTPEMIADLLAIVDLCDLGSLISG